MEFIFQLFLLHGFSFLSSTTVYSLPYEMTGGKCRDENIEYSPPTTNLCCSKCKPGTYLLNHCTAERDTVCKECTEGMFSSSMNYHHNCFRCVKCDKSKNLQYSKQCTKVNNSECECMPGMYCVSHQREQCTQCSKHKKCPAGQGVTSPGNSFSNVKCAACPEGTFSNEHSSTQPCLPHTKCDQGKVIEQYGSSSTDNICGQLPTHIIGAALAATSHTPYVTTQNSSSVSSTSNPTVAASLHTFDVTIEAVRSTSPTQEDKTSTNMIVAAVIFTLLLVVLAMMVFIIRHRKGLEKRPDEQATNNGQTLDHSFESRHLLGEGKADLFSSSSSSSSSDSHSQCTEASQDNILTEQPAVSSPCVNISFTATINCQLNQTQGSCSIPITPLTHPQPQPQPEVQPVQLELPLSQEEQICVSCEEENSKDALQSVQESGKMVC